MNPKLTKTFLLNIFNAGKEKCHLSGLQLNKMQRFFSFIETVSISPKFWQTLRKELPYLLSKMVMRLLPQSRIKNYCLSVTHTAGEVKGSMFFALHVT